MGTRGRKSAASLTVVKAAFPETRPTAPPGLTGAQADVWAAVVASEAAGMFGTAALRALLAEYCRHTVAAAVLAEQIDAFDVDWLTSDEGLKRYDLLLKMRDRETKASADKATKLRLTNQSRYTPQAAATASKRAGAAKKPWESD